MKLARRIATALDEVSRVAGKLADRLDPPRAVLERAEAAVVAEGIAQGRADLQRVHGWRPDPEPPSPPRPRIEDLLRPAVDADLRRRAEALQERARVEWNDLAARSWTRTLVAEVRSRGMVEP